MRKYLLISLISLLGFVGVSLRSYAAEDDIVISANTALVSEYRFRGVSISDRDIAVQAGFDVEVSNFYVGTWGSSIEDFNGSTAEVDVYGGFRFDIGEITLDVGTMLYAYPGGADTNYLEVYGSASGSFKTLDWTVGYAYVPSQENLGSTDNNYLYLDTGLPISNTPLSLSVHVGYEDGAFGDGKVDWSIGLNYDYKKINLGLSYVDTNKVGDNFKGGVVVILGASF